MALAQFYTVSAEYQVQCRWMYTETYALALNAPILDENSLLHL